MPLSTSLSLACLLVDAHSDDVLALRCNMIPGAFVQVAVFPEGPES